MKSAGRLEIALWWALVGAVVLCFAPVLLVMGGLWAISGGLENRAIALIAVAYLVSRQKNLLGAPPAAAVFQALGLFVLACGLFLVQLPALSLQNLAFCLALTGLALFRWGRTAVDSLARPLLIVAMIMSINGLADGWLPAYTPVVQWLQHLVAGLGAYLLWMAGLPVVLKETVITVGGLGGVDVNANCSGIRSLLEVGTLAAVAIMTISRRSWLDNLRYFLLCELVVLALNVLRILLLAVAIAYTNPHTFEALHEGWGASLYGSGISAVIVLFTSWYFQWNPFDSQSGSASA
ncbi:exosortase/archaeosortase family protein [Gloeobacter kilaueensis]|uniref:Eight transmembrane protein EpsH n=1 Tax=Gloeobacter kilaueensis (strain ATCC BAA-2537 / CCAP 1431/1 / ULC 316 / JS1) TaxID=1183438 RepID=U5QNQ7_GLOK1|nr:exosortase/archaeosortase family protein [Gloeobacter kilaueensis]AGY60513.1 eight transmembrane protein EpsH [Gloeobacter kilaueensis JS1]